MASVLSEIRTLVQQNANSLVEDGRVLIDGSHDPDVISVGDLDTSTTSFSTLASAANLTGQSAGMNPSTSMPNLTISSSLESLILGCAHNASMSNDSTGSSAGAPPSGRKPAGNTSADCGLSRAPLAKSLSEVKQVRS